MKFPKKCSFMKPVLFFSVAHCQKHVIKLGGIPLERGQSLYYWLSIIYSLIIVGFVYSNTFSLCD